ncbi:hypothetical protein MPLA_1140002 [Mesorhizobium sp. ORS 3359]|nr:hypothetical protein MPLA_1140002 [Mesorhizobium sp. ORS 3359]
MQSGERVRKYNAKRQLTEAFQENRATVYHPELLEQGLEAWRPRLSASCFWVRKHGKD